MTTDIAHRQPGALGGVATSRLRRRWPLTSVLAGFALIIGAAVFGVLSTQSIGTGHLDTKPLGQQIVFTPSGSYRASIYVTRELDAPPVCHVVTQAGTPVRLHSATPYTVNTRYSMEGTYGFHLQAGATYVVTCTAAGQQGSFAVVEVSPTAQQVAFPVGILGGLMVVAGIVGSLVRRRRRGPTTAGSA